MLIARDETYDRQYSGFSWELPHDFNIGRAVSDDWAARDPDRICLQHFSPDGNHRSLNYGEFASRTNQFARGLTGLDVGRGDRVALLLPQGFETAIAHVGCYKLGAIAVPLALLFGIEALTFRIRSSGASTIVTTSAGAEKILRICDDLPDLKQIILVDGTEISKQLRIVGFDDLLSSSSDAALDIKIGPEDPAMMIFTSGTTGLPKGALHAHRVLIGHIPGVQMHHELLPQPGDRLWTPADWAWAGGLLNVLLPGLLLGVPVVSSPAQKFDPELAFKIMADMEIRNVFIPPTALRIMRSVEKPRERYALKLRTVGSGGESLGRETYEWAKQALGLTINEFYGQTECNLVISSCAANDISKGGAIGKPVPGHDVAVIDENGMVVPTGVAGQIAVRRPDPVMFLGYWQNEEATRAKFIGDWLLTGDQGVADDEGYITFFGRDDDVITSAGYRIGPGEIEDCLLGHPAVALVAAVGKPDAVRTEIVKAYVVPAEGHQPSAELAEEIRLWVKTRLSAHEYPREIEFVDSLPLTTTGKVIRRQLRDRAIREAGPGH